MTKNKDKHVLGCAVGPPQGLRRLGALRSVATWSRLAHDLSLWPSSQQLHLLDKKFGGELLAADVLGVEVRACLPGSTPSGTSSTFCILMWCSSGLRQGVFRLVRQATQRPVRCCAVSTARCGSCVHPRRMNPKRMMTREAPGLWAGCLRTWMRAPLAPRAPTEADGPAVRGAAARRRARPRARLRARRASWPGSAAGCRRWRPTTTCTWPCGEKPAHAAWHG
jgi:hypothetical protein